MIDCHAHLRTKQIYPENLFYGRFDIPQALVDRVLAVVDDKVLDVADVATNIYGFITGRNQPERAVELVQAFNLLLEKQADLFCKHMKKAGVNRACILGLDIPNWSDLAAFDKEAHLVIQLEAFKAIKKAHPELSIFLPYDPRRPDAAKFVVALLQTDVFSGVKMYPALGFDVSDYLGERNKGLSSVYEQAEALGKPIVSHCSKGGIRGPEDHSGSNEYFSQPERWFSALCDFPKLKVCLAHGGGESSFRSLASQSKGWATSVEKGLTEFPNLYVDCAFHSGSVARSVDYFADLRKIMAGPFACQVLFGSDWPLHWITYEYETLINVWKSNCLQDLIDTLDFNAECFLGEQIGFFQ